jgi:hypothetical protein
MMTRLANNSSAYHNDYAILHSTALKNPPAQLDFSRALPGNIVQETGAGNTELNDYDIVNQRLNTRKQSPYEVRGVTTTVKKKILTIRVFVWTPTMKRPLCLETVAAFTRTGI